MVLSCKKLKVLIKVSGYIPQERNIENSNIKCLCMTYENLKSFRVESIIPVACKLFLLHPSGIISMYCMSLEPILLELIMAFHAELTYISEKFLSDGNHYT